MSKRLCLSIFLLLTIGVCAYSQCEVVNDAIKPGEELSYELKFNWKFIWINAGWAKMTTDTVTYEGKRCLRTDLESFTNKRIDMFFKMRDTLTCLTTENLVPLYFRKGAAEGKRYSVDDVKFSYRDGKCIVDQYRTVNGNMRRDCQESEACVYDMLSILLQARSYDATDYSPGDKILFPMATGKDIDKQTLIYRGKKVYKAENGMKFRCLVFSLVEYVKGKEKEIITFYVTDDRNHLPVRLDMYLNFGSAKAFLSGIKGNRHPLNSLVE